MGDHGRLVWCVRDGEGQARLSPGWVRDADWVEHLDLLQDWIADLQAKYDARFARMPDWHQKTWNDRDEIAAANEAKRAAEAPNG